MKRYEKLREKCVRNGSIELNAEEVVLLLQECEFMSQMMRRQLPLMHELFRYVETRGMELDKEFAEGLLKECLPQCQELAAISRISETMDFTADELLPVLSASASKVSA